MKNIKFVSIVIILCLVYGGFLTYNKMRLNKGEAPRLSVKQDVIEMSVKDKDEKFLKGVRAQDKEDGDLTKDVFIQSMSPFDENQERIVTYAVFDQDDNIATITQKVKYKDYQPPKIKVEKPLIIYNDDYEASLNDFVSATSSFGENLSSKVTVKEPSDFSKNDMYVDFSVTDSCGVTATEKFHVHRYLLKPNIEIKLKNYHIFVDKNTSIDALSYVDSVKNMGIEDQNLVHQIKVRNNYDASKEGTYEFIYTLNDNGNTGMTKLLVTVE